MLGRTHSLFSSMKTITKNLNRIMDIVLSEPYANREKNNFVYWLKKGEESQIKGKQPDFESAVFRAKISLDKLSQFQSANPYIGDFQKLYQEYRQDIPMNLDTAKTVVQQWPEIEKEDSGIEHAVQVLKIRDFLLKCEPDILTFKDEPWVTKVMEHAIWVQSSGIFINHEQAKNDSDWFHHQFPESGQYDFLKKRLIHMYDAPFSIRPHS